jgi:hypothetical protein
MCGGIKKREPVAQKIWEGEIRGTKLRILQVAENDCYVEELLDSEEVSNFSTEKVKDHEGVWQAAEDELASEAYMIAFLETRKQLKAVADFAVGNHP